MLPQELPNIMNELNKLLISASSDKFKRMEFLLAARKISIKVLASISYQIEEVSKGIQFSDLCDLCSSDSRSRSIKTTLGSAGSMFLCFKCFSLEISLRKSLNTNLPPDTRFKIVEFKSQK